MMDAGPLSGLSILIIDDSDLTRDVLKTMLSRFGVCEVHEAKDGHAGFAVLVRQRIDIIICDVFMVPMHGLRFLEMLRAGQTPADISGPVACDTPVIIVTGKAAKDMMDEADAGWNAILGKPIKPAALLAVLHRLVREKALAGGR